MRLEAGHPEDDLDARLLQGLRDFDVVALVEPRLEFNHHLDLLAVERGAGERVDDVRILRHTIEVDPDGLDFRIDRRLPQQVHQLGKSVIGIMEQDVPPRDLLEVARPPLQMAMRQGAELAVDQSGPPEVGKVHQVLAVVVPAPGDDARLVHHAQLSDQKFQQLLRHGPIVEKAHVVTLLPSSDALPHLLEQRLGEVIVHVNLRVPRHLDGKGGHRRGLKRGEQPGQSDTDHIVQEHDAVASFLLGQNQEPVEVIGQFEQSEPRPLRHLPLEGDGVIDGPVLQLGHAHIGDQNGHQMRTDLPIKPASDELPLLLVELILGHEVNAFIGQLRFDLLEGGIVARLELNDPLVHCIERFSHPVAERGRGALSDQGNALQGRHPHAEKLIEVVGEDAKEPHPLDQWHVLVLRLLQDALIECEPTDLPVEEFIFRGQPLLALGLAGLARGGHPREDTREHHQDRVPRVNFWRPRALRPSTTPAFAPCPCLETPPPNSPPPPSSMAKSTANSPSNATADNTWSSSSTPVTSPASAPQRFTPSRIASPISSPATPSSSAAAPMPRTSTNGSSPPPRPMAEQKA